MAIDTGYESGHVLTARIDLARQNYDEERGRVFQQQLIERLQARPGVEAAGFAVTLPLNDGRWENPIRRDGDPTRVQTFQNVVSPRYFDAMQHPVARWAGILRVTMTTDRQGGDPQPDARANHVAGRERAGTTTDVQGPDDRGHRRGARHQRPEPVRVAWSDVLSCRCRSITNRTSSCTCAASVPPAQVVAGLRREVQTLDKDLPVYGVKALDEHVTATLTPQRLLAHLISGFGCWRCCSPASACMVCSLTS